jgi:hypothetical protein
MQSAAPYAHGELIGSTKPGSLFFTLPTRWLTGQEVMQSDVPVHDVIGRRLALIEIVGDRRTSDLTDKRCVPTACFCRQFAADRETARVYNFDVARLTVSKSIQYEPMPSLISFERRRVICDAFLEVHSNLKM